MPNADIVLRPFAPQDIDGAVLLSRAAGWPHRAVDWALVLSQSHGTVATLAGRVVGTIMTTIYGDTALINMVIVDEAMRGRGLGRRMMDAALAAAAGRDCQLVATEAGLPLYEKLGFCAMGRVLQHQGVAPHAVDLPTENVAWSTELPIEVLARLDRLACGLDRALLIDRLVSDGRVAILERDGSIDGFAILRPFGRGEVIGPVVAQGVEEACALIAFIAAERPGVFLRIDIPEAAGLGAWLAKRGLTYVGGGLSMRRGETPPQASGPYRTFALVSQALG